MIKRSDLPANCASRLCAAFSLITVLTACGTLKQTHLNMVENGRHAHYEVTRLVTPADLEICAKKISEQTGALLPPSRLTTG
jgi:hypothetical protein